MLLQAATLLSDSIFPFFLVELALLVSNKSGVAHTLIHLITVGAEDIMCNCKLFRNVGATVALRQGRRDRQCRSMSFQLLLLLRLDTEIMSRGAFFRIINQTDAHCRPWFM